MGTNKVAFVGVLCGGATGSHVTGSDVSHETRSDVIHEIGSDVSDVTGRGPDRKYVMRMRNRKLRNIGPNRGPKVTLVTTPEVTSFTRSEVTSVK